MSYLKDIAVFVRVVQLKGFAAAGRDLGLTAPSISKQIARLEHELGVLLLHRTTHNLFLTDAGREFYERSLGGLAQIEEARAAALSFNDELRGKIRVHATLSVGQALIVPALVDFMAANPKIRIDLDMSSIPVNPMEHQVDIAIRTRNSREGSPGEGKAGHISIGRRVLGRVRPLVVAAPDYLERTGRPADIDEINQRDCLVYVTQSTSSENWAFHKDGPNGGHDIVLKVEPVLRSNNWLAVRTAAVAGLGIARLPDFTVRDELESGRLVPLFEEQTRSDQQVLALFPKGPRMPAKMRLLLDFLACRVVPEAREKVVPEAREKVGSNAEEPARQQARPVVRTRAGPTATAKALGERRPRTA